MPVSRVPGVPLTTKLGREALNVGLQRATHERPHDFDHDALLSLDEKQASITSPDYADLASTEPLSCKGISNNIGIIRRSA